MAYHLHRSLWLPAPIADVFDFFSRAANLERLTPAHLRFRILTPEPIAMHPGALIDYRIHLRGLPLRWQTEITQWAPPTSFVDVQRRGPYKRWEHRHTFTTIDGGTRVDDDVVYEVWGGAVIRRLFVAPELERIFDYRTTAMRSIFGGDDRRAPVSRP